MLFLCECRRLLIAVVNVTVDMLNVGSWYVDMLNDSIWYTFTFVCLSVFPFPSLQNEVKTRISALTNTHTVEHFVAASIEYIGKVKTNLNGLGCVH